MVIGGGSGCLPERMTEAGCEKRIELISQGVQLEDLNSSGLSDDKSVQTVGTTESSHINFYAKFNVQRMFTLLYLFNCDECALHSFKRDAQCC